MLPDDAPSSTSQQRDGDDSPHTEDGEISDRAASPSTSTKSVTDNKETAAPPLPQNEEPPPLPEEAPPFIPVDDGWDPVWDEGAQAFYFYNRFTQLSQWENPRVPDAKQAGPPGVANHDRLGPPTSPPPARKVGGYDPAIHGDYDPNADYAKVYKTQEETNVVGGAPGTDPAEAYAATGHFNRFTGKWQAADLNPDKFSDEQKSRRQMNAFFDVDAAANTHDGRSLRAERANKKLSKAELKAFKEKRREKKEEKRRAWLRD
ncbi:hypothetical protein LTR10_021152 [Elasticomyces elasticus]|nr:hypothetical protein LTR10_021152 [Elasticomyces elasticus]